MSATTHGTTRVRRLGAGLLTYDADRKRVWIAGQRLHHGLTGALVAGAGMAGLAVRRLTPRGGLEIALLGSLLIAHDWQDRGRWFELGAQSEDRGRWFELGAQSES